MHQIQSKLQHNYSKIYRVVIVAVTVGLMMFLSPRTSKFQYEFDQGFPWHHSPLYSPFSFGINKTPEQISVEQTNIRNASYLYFDIDNTIGDSVTSNFTAKAEIIFTQDSTLEKSKKSQFIRDGKKIIQLIYKTGVIANEDSLRNKQPEYIIKVIDNRVEKQYEIKQFFTIAEAFDSVQVWSQKFDNKKMLDLTILENIRQNITLNKELTKEILTQKLDALTPVYGKVNEGEKIVDKGEIITPEIYQKLVSLQEAYEKQTGQDQSQLFVYGGTFIFLAFATFILILVVKLYSPSTYSETNAFTLILLLFLMNYVLANVPRFFPEIEIYALPFALFAVILQSFFRASLASIVFMIMMTLAGLIAPNGIEFIWIEIPSGLLAILLLNNLRKRSQLLLVITIVFVTSSLLYFAASIIKEGDINNVVFSNFTWFAVSAILTVIAIPIVFIIERVFGLISEMALLELADTNNTLLRKLAQIAPGTFQHSMQVANLAEECALEIGGDALLIRTGALYHDIGKMKNPTFFIENQVGGHNPHDDLSEKESAKIIIDHVINGVEMAKKHKLPEKIIDFIRTHHGTTTTRYFLYQAQQKEGDVEVTDFQYPGPLPFSKETAILMLCDGVEAAARSLPEYSAETINNLIEGIFSTVLNSNQLDYAPITLQNITTLKKLLQKKIMNIYHVRVAYPSA